MFDPTIAAPSFADHFAFQPIVATIAREARASEPTQNLTRVTIEGSTGVDDWLTVTIQPRGARVLTFEWVPFATQAATSLAVTASSTDGLIPARRAGSRPHVPAGANRRAARLHR